MNINPETILGKLKAVMLDCVHNKLKFLFIATAQQTHHYLVIIEACG